MRAERSKPVVTTLSPASEQRRSSSLPHLSSMQMTAAGRVILAEQARLRLEVGLEGVMVVEVVLRQVENAVTANDEAYVRSRSSAWLELTSMATTVQPASRMRAKQMLQVGRFRRGVRRLLVYVADDGAHGTDDARSLARHAGDMLHQIRGGGFAVGARDAHQRNRARDGSS